MNKLTPKQNQRAQALRQRVETARNWAKSQDNNPSGRDKNGAEGEITVFSEDRWTVTNASIQGSNFKYEKSSGMGILGIEKLSAETDDQGKTTYSEMHTDKAQTSGSYKELVVDSKTGQILEFRSEG